MRLSKTILSTLVLFTAALNVHAELSCASPLVEWSDTTPAVNLKHIFCGESHNGKLKGFHSKALIASSEVSTVTNIEVLTGGIYNGQSQFKQGGSKFSTFFPDHCTLATITRSVVYAATHKTGNHSQWGILGQSAPVTNNSGYCLTTEGQAFTIRMGLIHGNSKVNTAFPQP